MAQAKCLHSPRVLMAASAKHKDGSPVMVCKACQQTAKRKYWRRKWKRDEWWERQGGMCAFCDEPLVDDNTTHREHNHTTGEERGLVHARCNQMISGIEDAMALIGIERVVRWMQKA